MYWQSGIQTEQELKDNIDEIYEQYQIFTDPFATGTGDSSESSGSTEFLSETEIDPISTEEIIASLLGQANGTFPSSFLVDL